MKKSLNLKRKSISTQEYNKLEADIFYKYLKLALKKKNK
jgi:hypothetical protein